MTSESDPTASREPSTDLAWWSADINHKITDEVRNLLETYSSIPSDQITPHVNAIREQAFHLRPYPCTGLAGFLAPALPHHPSYPSIIQRLKAGGKLLDIGCFIGQDLRRLVIDGVPQENLCGMDIVNHWDLGYTFFNDKKKFQVKYIQGDILNPGEEVDDLQGKIDVVHVSHLLHQWGWDTQIKAANVIVGLANEECVIVGFQAGTSDIEKRREWNETKFWMHDVSSFRRMWDVVGEATGTKWECEAEVRPWGELGYSEDEVGYLGEDFVLMRFEVRRIG